MRLAFIFFALCFLLPSIGKSQYPIDTMEMDMDNIHVAKLSGTWYDNMWEKPALRGFTLSRTRKDSTWFSITFIPDGTISSENYRDTSQIAKSCKWWYDGTFFYLKEPAKTYYKKVSLVKDKDGDIVIEYRPTGWVFLIDPTPQPCALPVSGRKERQ